MTSYIIHLGIIRLIVIESILFVSIAYVYLMALVICFGNVWPCHDALPTELLIMLDSTNLAVQITH